MEEQGNYSGFGRKRKKYALSNHGRGTFLPRSTDRGPLPERPMHYINAVRRRYNLGAPILADTPLRTGARCSVAMPYIDINAPQVLTIVQPRPVHRYCGLVLVALTSYGSIFRTVVSLSICLV